MRWVFFIDANLEPRIAELLRKKGYRAEFADYVLDENANDEADILPYVDQEELVIVTDNIKNFALLSESRHEGLFLLNDQRASAYSVAQDIRDIIQQVGDPDNLNDRTLTLDPWIQE